MGIFTNDTKKVEIRCAGHTEVMLEELDDLQGNLKTKTDEGYYKQGNSLIKYGFSFPFFYWEDQNGKKWTMDGHRRKPTLQRMRDEGIIIDGELQKVQIPEKYPADPIFAKDKAEAKEKLLVLQSRYEKITEEGMDEFIHEEGAEIETAGLTDFVELDDISFDEDYEESEEEEKPKKEKEPPCEKCTNYHERNHDEEV